MASTGSALVASTTSVAPNCLAHSSLLPAMSTPMIRVARASRAPMITLLPMPPQPNTATLLPRRTPAEYRAAPTPVVTPQPSSEACSGGQASGTFTACRAATTV
jgi:hypothetical protein